jgi:hypothetical protein
MWLSLPVLGARALESSQCALPPNAPINLAAAVDGLTVTLTWASSGGCEASNFAVHAGTAAGSSNAAIVNVGRAFSLTASAPPGTYYIRVYAQNAFGSSGPSNEIQLRLGGEGVPGLVFNLAGTIAGNSVTLNWIAPSSGPPTSFVIEAGRSAGATNVAAFDIGSAATRVTFTGVPAGTYYVRVRAKNSAGVGAPSNEVVLDVGARCVASSATLRFIFVPAYGSSDNLRGHVCHVNPADYRVAVYIKVGTGYWIKPFANQPLTAIAGDGSWVADITTGGSDALATEVRAYLVNRSYSPPILLGNASIPAALDANALAIVFASRAPEVPYRGPVAAPVGSSFDSGLDGWSGAGVRFVSQIGSPPGSMEYQQAAGGDVATAPAKFLGVWADLDGRASIVFQHRVSLGGIAPGFWGAAGARQIRLSGPGGAATWTGPVPTFSDNWFPVVANITASDWTITRGTWLHLLDQVTALEVRVNHFADLFGAERTQFDNVFVLPR